MSVVVGTAGHINHGKTSLVGALTGQETDRLPEERRRGLTIELGFAGFTLPSGLRAAFVDVPGHERFIRHMVAGVHGMDLICLVVAADDGVMPQTREHLIILQLLGVTRGLWAVTKCDRVGPDRVQAVAAACRTLLPEALRDTWPVCPVSVVTGEGLDTLRDQLDELAGQVPAREMAGRARLPVDRVFTRPGFGTVVTGTLTRGRLRRHDVVVLAPDGISGRIRQLEVHGQPVAEAVAGQRVAVNLTGVERRQVARGEVLSEPGSLTGHTTASVMVSVAAGGRALAHGARVHVHTGTAVGLARVFWKGRGGPSLAAGETAEAEIRWERPTPFEPGDRVLLRSYSPATTIGGGVVLEVDGASRHRGTTSSRVLVPGGAAAPALEDGAWRRLRQAETPLTWEELAGGSAMTSVELASALSRHPDVVKLDPTHVLSRDLFTASQQRIIERLTAYHATHPLRRGCPPAAVQALFPAWAPRQVAALIAATDEVVRDGPGIRLATFTVRWSEEARRWRRQVLERLSETTLAVPPLAELWAALGIPPEQGRDLLDALVGEGEVRPLDARAGWYVTRAVYQAAQETVEEALRQAGVMTTGALREVLGTRRRYAVAFLERLDESHVTRRVGDQRRLVSP